MCIRDSFKTAYPDWFNHFIRVEGDDTYLSLPRLNVLQLKAEGISEDHIDIDSHCTRCETEMFFSYDRKDYDVSNPRTRNWSFIMK